MIDRRPTGMDEEIWELRAVEYVTDRNPVVPVVYLAMAVSIGGVVLSSLIDRDVTSRIAYPYVMTIAALTMTVSLSMALIECKRLLSPIEAEYDQFLNEIVLYPEAQKIIESRVLHGKPVRGLDMWRALVKQLPMMR